MKMELELGLAPPTQIGFDLNNVFQPKDMFRDRCALEIKDKAKNKPSFAEAFEHDGGAATDTLPLLLWNGQPNEEDDHQKRQKRRRSNTSIKSGAEEDHLVGWPAIKSWRRNFFHGHEDCQLVGHWKTERGNSRTNTTNTMYIKVKMEGMAIGRKINLRLYHSYQTLTDSLVNMFIKRLKSDVDGANYTLLYQDKDGDWLLAGDVPWHVEGLSLGGVKMVKAPGLQIQHDTLFATSVVGVCRGSAEIPCDI
ncbi:unnamed protein product [Ilex paraguariensis]|uniref:Auxin-responsive protein n=1 Tax=Ilex paraguariensis TaxID=185542 RepID=A0ABC8TLT4_9AQUA